MEEIKINDTLTISGGQNDNPNQDLFVPDPGAAMIAIGTGVMGGVIGGIPGGPPGMITGGAIGGTSAAIGVISYDAYQIHQSIEQGK